MQLTDTKTLYIKATPESLSALTEDRVVKGGTYYAGFFIRGI